MASVAILGAGLLGRLLALQLCDDYDVHLYDKDKGDAEHSAAILAAAMLAPLAESVESGAEVMALGRYAQTLWPQLLEKLPDEVFFQQNGTLVVAFDQDRGSLENLRLNLKDQSYQTVAAHALQSYERGLNPRLRHGLFLPEEGQLDNRQLLRALAKVLVDKVQWHTQADIEEQEGSFSVNGAALPRFDHVIDCRGVGAKTSDSELRGVRGEVLRLYAPDVTLNRPVRLMHPRYPIYIAPKQNHIFVVGATQLESEDQRQPTVRSALELLSACFSLHSGFAEAEILEMRAGLRPAYADNEPRISQQGRVIRVNGLYRHGYLLSPAVSLAVVQLLKFGEVSPEITQCLPELWQACAQVA